MININDYNFYKLCSANDLKPTFNEDFIAGFLVESEPIAQFFFNIKGVGVVVMASDRASSVILSTSLKTIDDIIYYLDADNNVCMGVLK